MSYLLHQATLPNATTQCERDWTIVNGISVIVQHHQTSQRHSGRYFLILDRDKEGMIEKIFEITKGAIGYPELVICVGGNKVSRMLGLDEKTQREDIEACFDMVSKAYGEIMLPSKLPPNKLLASDGDTPVMTYETEQTGVRVAFNFFGEKDYQVPIPRAITRDALFALLLEAKTLFTLNKKHCRVVGSASVAEFPKPEVFTIEFLPLSDKKNSLIALHGFVEHIERQFGTLKF
jgi:hypothetical protein